MLSKKQKKELNNLIYSDDYKNKEIAYQVLLGLLEQKIKRHIRLIISNHWLKFGHVKIQYQKVEDKKKSLKFLLITIEFPNIYLFRKNNEWVLVGDYVLKEEQTAKELLKALSSSKIFICERIYKIPYLITDYENI